MGSRVRAAAFFAAALVFVLGLGWYRAAISDAESVHFALNYPASGTAAGGVGAMGKDGIVVVNLADTGVLKRMVQPNLINLSSHWLRNVGTRPRRVSLEITGTSYPVRWESNEKTWEPATHTIGRSLAPSSTATVDWYIELPDRLPPGDVLVDARILVRDTADMSVLTSLPLKVVKNNAAARKAVEAARAGGDCCGGK